MTDTELRAHLELFALGASTPGIRQPRGESSMAIDITADVDRIAGRALQVLGDHMDDTDKYAPAYARQYARALMTGGKRPLTVKLHPDVAHLLRDLVQDELMFERRGYDRRKDVA